MTRPEIINWLTPPEGMPTHIKTTSLSREQCYSNCPRQAYLKFAAKIPGPERVVPEGQEAANVRGIRLHEEIADFITGKTDTLSEDIEHRRDVIISIREANNSHIDTVAVEERWCFNDAWEVVNDRDWDNLWFIVIADAVNFIEDDECEIYDWKSGKKQYNEIKHGWQLLIYAVATFMKFPELERVYANLEYIDVNESTTLELTRAKAMSHFLRVNGKLLAVTKARSFPPTPSRNHCRFCDYKTGPIDANTDGTGHCDQNPE